MGAASLRARRTFTAGTVPWPGTALTWPGHSPAHHPTVSRRPRTRFASAELSRAKLQQTSTFVLLLWPPCLSHKGAAVHSARQEAVVPVTRSPPPGSQSPHPPRHSPHCLAPQAKQAQAPGAAVTRAGGFLCQARAGDTAPTSSALADTQLVGTQPRAAGLHVCRQ